jgi:CRP/FNR family transcriptional regulator
MTISCVECPLRQCRGFEPMTAEELAFQESFKIGERVVPAGRTFLSEGDSSPHLFTVLRGMGLRHISLPEGQRQVVNFVFPGDFIGLQAGVMAEMKHSVEATSQMTLCVFNRSDLYKLFNNHPQRAYDLTWLAAAEEHFLGQALAMVGQLGAAQRMAWALARCLMRGRATGLAQDWSMPFPYRQRDLADALGLSLVHTNKTLARLRAMGLVDWLSGRLNCSDPVGLFALADLDLEAEMRRPLF